MKQLILIRHAKSDWSHELTDHGRPLNARGRGAAPAIGDWLRQNAYPPDEVLCSTATRTRETLSLLGLDAPTRFEPALYHAAPETMLRLLRGATGDSVLMLGHNPGIADFAECLLEQPPAHRKFAAYPTCATLVAIFDIDTWHDLQPGTGRTEGFIVPRDLTG